MEAMADSPQLNQFMANRQPSVAWLVPKSGDRENLILFLRAYGGLEIIERPAFLEIASRNPESEIDLAHLREKCLEELFQDFVAFTPPSSPGFSEAIVVPALEKISAGIYSVLRFITAVSLANIQPAKKWLKTYYQNLCGMEVLQTIQGFIQADQNASQAAKALYMHRNTVNYRLDLFIRRSQIDVRSFQGAYALYLLFHS